MKNITNRSGWSLLGLFIVNVLLCIGCVTQQRGVDLSIDYYNIGNAYQELGEYSRAIEFYQRALSLNPALMNASYNLALALMMDGRYEEADEILLTLSAEDPENVRVLYARASSYHLQGEDERALKILNDILEFAPEHTDARYSLAVILWKLDRLAEAEEEFYRLLEQAPEDLDNKFNLANILLDQEKIEDAVVFLEEYLQEKPDDIEAYLMLANGYVGLRQYYKALDSYTAILTLDERNKKAWFEYARILLTKVEDPERGITSLRQAIDYGYRDRKALSLLLETPDLLEREAVEDLLEEKGLSLSEE